MQLLSVQVFRLRHSATGSASAPAGKERPVARVATRRSTCCGSRPRPAAELSLAGAMHVVHASLESREAGLAMPRNTIEISSDGHARCMGCQHSTAASPHVKADAVNGAQFSYRIEESTDTFLRHNGTLQHAPSSDLTLLFILQPRTGGKQPFGRVEVDVAALRDGESPFDGWVSMTQGGKRRDKANVVAELQIRVAWLSGSCTGTTVQLVGGDAHHEIKQRFSLLESLGSGSFATVWRAVPVSRVRNKGSSEGQVAIKLVDKAKCIRAGDRQAAMQLIREQQLLCDVHHPRIASCSAIVDGITTAAYVMALGGPRTLLSVLERSADPMAEATAALILQDVAAALEFMHGCHIVHRDIKPDNVLLTPLSASERQRRPRHTYTSVGNKQQYRALLADLGFATRLGPGELALTSNDVAHTRCSGGGAISANSSPPRWMAHSLIGSGQYLAPEIILTMRWDSYASQFVPDPTTAGYDCLADIWALGVTLYKALSNRDLHTPGIKFKSLHDWSQRGAPVPYPPDEWERISERAVAICKSMLVPIPQDRATAATVRESACLWESTDFDCLVLSEHISLPPNLTELQKQTKSFLALEVLSATNAPIMLSTAVIHDQANPIS